VNFKNEKPGSFSFDLKGENAVLNLIQGAEKYSIAFGSGEWVKAETNKMGPNLFTFAQNHQVGLAPFKIAGSFAWLDANTVEFKQRYIESPHSEIIQIKFDGEKASITFIDNFERKAKKPEYEAKGEF